MKYANYDKTTGKLLGWYSLEINGSNIPTPNIEVSEADWQVALDNGYNFVDATIKTLGKKDFRTFPQLQTAKLGYVKSSFNTTLEAGYATSKGIKMDATIQAISTLNAGHTLAVASGTTTMDIRDYDNVVHIGVAIADVQIMLVELGSNYQVQLNKKWALEAQVKACITQADLDKIVW